MKYRFSDSFLEEIHEKNDIETVISSYVELKRRGRTLMGLCPFHNEKTPSFTVYPETSSYYCFGCGAGGDVITFVKSIENLDYTDAVKLLADRAGIHYEQTQDNDYGANLKKRIYEANREAAKFFHETLYTEKGNRQLSYLINRGVSKEMITHFGLGAAPDGWHDLTEHLLNAGFKRNELVAANLVRVSEKNGKKYYYDAFRNKVMYPVIDVRGNVIAFGGRVLDNSKPKYINTADTPVYKKSRELFALNFAKNGNDRKLILCEGYMDVIALHSAGFTNAVAGLGTALTAEQVSLISRYADEVSLCYDSDEAGQKAVKAALKLFSETGIKTKVIKIDGGKDPDEIIKTYGKERFKSLLNGASNDIEYKLNNVKDKYDITSDDGKINYLNEASRILATVGVIERDVYAMRLSDELDVSKEAILLRIKKYSDSNIRQKKKNVLADEKKTSDLLTKSVDPEQLKNKKSAKAEEIILITLLNNGSFYRKLESELTNELFVTPVNKNILSVICDRLKEGLSVDLQYLTPLLDENETRAAAKLFANKGIVTNTIEECLGCIGVLKEEKEKLTGKKPSDMADSEFLAFFSSKKQNSDDF